MNENTIKLDFLEEDPTLIRNLVKVALDSNFSSIMITRANAGYPILYVNSAFTELTGYSYDEVVGKEPGLLQGPKTDQSLLHKLRETLESDQIFHGKTVNYRKDGTEFMMEWKIFPIKNSENRTSHFLAVQRAN
jgi:PAS domain S-box-containing protein